MHFEESSVDLSIQLIKGCLENDVEIVSKCLKDGVRPRKRLLNGRTLLGLVAEEGHIEVMSLLLENKPKLKVAENILPDPVTPEGMGDLEWDGEMSENNSMSVLGSDPESCLYIWYANILAKTGPCLQQIPEDVDAEDDSGRKALHYAVSAGHMAAVELLLSAGCSVNDLDKKNMTPVYCAVQVNRPDILKLLLDHGAHYRQVAPKGLTELHWSTKYGYYECSKLLIAAGWDLNAQGFQNGTPLQYAVNYARHDIAKLLIESGKKRNRTIPHLSTALEVAFKRKDLEMVKILKSAGAKFTSVRSFYSVMNNFIENKRTVLLEAALKCRGDISLEVEREGETPLTKALMLESIPMARILIENGASITWKYPVIGLNTFDRFFCSYVNGRNIYCNMLHDYYAFFQSYGWEPSSELIRKSMEVSVGYQNYHAIRVLLRCYPHFKNQVNAKCQWNFKHPAIIETLIRSNIIPLKSDVDTYEPLTLQDYSRLAYRRSIKGDLFRAIDDLLIPKTLKVFLKLQDILCDCEIPSEISSLFYRKRMRYLDNL